MKNQVVALAVATFASFVTCNHNDVDRKCPEGHLRFAEDCIDINKLITEARYVRNDVSLTCPRGNLRIGNVCVDVQKLVYDSSAYIKINRALKCPIGLLRVGNVCIAVDKIFADVSSVVLISRDGVCPARHLRIGNICIDIETIQSRFAPYFSAAKSELAKYCPSGILMGDICIDIQKLFSTTSAYVDLRAILDKDFVVGRFKTWKWPLSPVLENNVSNRRCPTGQKRVDNRCVDKDYLDLSLRSKDKDSKKKESSKKDKEEEKDEEAVLEHMIDVPTNMKRDLW